MAIFNEMRYIDYCSGQGSVTICEVSGMSRAATRSLMQPSILSPVSGHSPEIQAKDNVSIGSVPTCGLPYVTSW
jgi:hypothetical protein